MEKVNQMKNEQQIRQKAAGYFDDFPSSGYCDAYLKGWMACRAEEVDKNPPRAIKAVGIRAEGNEVVVEIEVKPGEYVELGRESLDAAFSHWWNLHAYVDEDSPTDDR